MSKILFATLLAVSVTFSAQAQTNPKFHAISEELVKDAKSAFGSNDFEHAKVQYEKAIVADPSNIDALIGLGNTHEKIGNLGKGLKYYRQALEIEPNDQNALRFQALAFLKRDMPDRAHDNEEKLARLCPAGCAALTEVKAAVDSYLAKVESAENTSATSENLPKS